MSASGLRRYNVADLLALRHAATNQAALNLCLCDEINLNTPTTERKVADTNAIIKFRKNPVGNSEVKFVEDMDVTVSQIVHAYNLSEGVTWPVLKTYCEKTVGVPALDLRMMRRKKPAEARIIFRSNEEAQKFLDHVPPHRSLKGRVPRFEMESAASKGNAVVACAVPATCEVSFAKVSVVEDDMQIEVAQVSEVIEDDCCEKAAKNVEESTVPAAVALDMSSKRPPTLTRAKSAASKMVEVAESPKVFQRAQSTAMGFQRAQSTVVGMCLDRLRRFSGVAVGDGIWNLNTNH